MSSQFLTVDEAAERMGVSRWTITRLITAKRLKAIQLGTGSKKNYRIEPSDLTTIAPPEGDQSLPVTIAPLIPRPNRRRRQPVPSSIKACLPRVA